MATSDLRAVLLCVTGMAIVGSSVSISQLVLDYPILTGQAVRYALAAAALAAIARWLPALGGAPAPAPGRPTGRELAILTALAATGLAGFNACVLIALEHADPAVVGTVIGTSPLGLALLGPLVRRTPVTLRLVSAAVVVVAGTAAVQGTGRSDAVGLLASLGALVGEVSFSVLAVLVLPRLGAVRVAAWSCALAVPLLALAGIAVGEPARWRPPTTVEATTLLYLALMMTVVAFLAWFTGLRRLGVARAGIIVGVMPVATLATAAVQAGVLPTAGQALGVLLVATGLGIGLTTRTDRRARTSPTASPPRPVDQEVRVTNPASR